MVIRFQVNRRVDQCGGSASNTMIFFFILSKRIYFFYFFHIYEKRGTWISGFEKLFCPSPAMVTVSPVRHSGAASWRHCRALWPSRLMLLRSRKVPVNRPWLTGCSSFCHPGCLVTASGRHGGSNPPSQRNDTGISTSGWGFRLWDLRKPSYLWWSVSSVCVTGFWRA